jgi:hypothetical protein
MPQPFKPGDSVIATFVDARGETIITAGIVESWDGESWIVSTDMGFATHFTDDMVRPA